ncbi:hypothetical protein TSMEX_009778 [Taenia solium]|eukprot:TsM_000609300 transcript=TsM_000609300 gene=TsM_000609300
MPMHVITVLCARASRRARISTGEFLPLASPDPTTRGMDYATCYHSNSDADQPVYFTTNCSLDVVMAPTQSVCVSDSFEVQFACPNDTTVTRASAFVHASGPQANVVNGAPGRLGVQEYESEGGVNADLVPHYSEENE